MKGKRENKQVLFPLLVIFFLAGSLSTVSAQAAEVDNEVDAFSSVFGAKIRLMQLEQRLNGNLKSGWEIIDEVDSLKDVKEDDSKELKALIYDLRNIKDEVSQIDNTKKQVSVMSDDQICKSIDVINSISER